MKTFFLVLVSILVSLTTATHWPGHMSPRKHAKHPKLVEDEDRRLQGDIGGDDNGGGDDGGNDDNGGDGDDMGGLGGGIGGGLGGVGAGGAGGYRALRSDELVDANAEGHQLPVSPAMDHPGDDEVVVAGGTVVRGGAVVARPGPRRRWY